MPSRMEWFAPIVCNVDTTTAIGKLPVGFGEVAHILHRSASQAACSASAGWADGSCFCLIHSLSPHPPRSRIGDDLVALPHVPHEASLVRSI